MPEILHVTTRASWEQAVADGEYRSETLATEGFTHCCLSDQLSGVVSQYFKGQTGLIVLRIDDEKLKPALKWESPPGTDEDFPHVYWPITLDAVVEVMPLEALISEEPGG